MIKFTIEELEPIVDEDLLEALSEVMYIDPSDEEKKLFFHEVIDENEERKLYRHQRSTDTFCFVEKDSTKIINIYQLRRILYYENLVILHGWDTDTVIDMSTGKITEE
jgi:hypothetical protein